MKALLLSLKIFLIILGLVGISFFSFSPLGGIIILLIVFTLFISLTIAGKRRKKIERLPVLTENAEVISKHVQVAGPYLLTNTYYYITFKLTNNVRKALLIPTQLYGTILEGEVGLLSYKEQGKIIKFIDFRKN